MGQTVQSICNEIARAKLIDAGVLRDLTRRWMLTPEATEFLVDLLERCCEVSQKARQVVVGFIQGQPCRWKVDLREPVDHARVRPLLPALDRAGGCAVLPARRHGDSPAQRRRHSSAVGTYQRLRVTVEG